MEEEFEEIDIKFIQDAHYDENGELVLGEKREATMWDLADLMDQLDRANLTLRDLLMLAREEEED